ncbi:trans-sulfuration enzyme family protein [Trueperella bialowiezensis]|uniref:Homocysteine desulfhydrase n=1 Tax=Trueperella bialowiezensis TaxID=312285 RepID=A0A3S4YZ01_9ACTO|nr:PLP-dependent aspartate aminotransferase family protein [Trueperella bialowiezensis]VEI13904.1 Cystathionine gamma-lyase [Trueperella bialowiezensis]
MRRNSRLIHGSGKSPDRGIVPAIQLSSTFAQPTDGTFGPHAYQRGSNPTRAAAETLLAAIEDARHAAAFATGMAATASIFSLVDPGQRVLLSRNLYGGTYRYATTYFPKYGISYDFLDDPNSLTADAIPDDTALIFIETPTNPGLEVIDIARVAAAAKAKGVLFAVDNTFLTARLQRPLELGADVSVYSATKYLGGHGDLLAGAVVTNDDDLIERVQFHRNTYGSPLAPFDSYSLIRGIKTLDLRLARQQDNTLAVIDFLSNRPEISRVNYAGSRSAQEAEIQRKQARGIGAVLSFELAPDVDHEAFVSNLGFIDYAVSLGGVESLICTPATMTHESFTEADRAKAGISDTLLRFAVGIEDIDDIIDTLSSALEAAARTR